MLCMARARRRSARPSGLDPLRVNRSHFARRSVAAACPHRAHRLERLEPYEGKLSSTVLRGGRAGDSPPPLDPLACAVSSPCLDHPSPPKWTPWRGVPALPRTRECARQQQTQRTLLAWLRVEYGIEK